MGTPPIHWGIPKTTTLALISEFLPLLMPLDVLLIICVRFQPRSQQPALRRRRNLLLRLLLLSTAGLALLFFIFPSFRSSILPIISLGLFSSTTEDLQLET